MFGKRKSERPSLLERAAETVRRAMQPQAPAPPADPPPPAAPQTSILLTPGPHVINGQKVDVPRDGDRDHVWYPLPPGRHVVDNRIAIVHPIGPFSAP